MKKLTPKSQLAPQEKKEARKMQEEFWNELRPHWQASLVVDRILKRNYAAK